MANNNLTADPSLKRVQDLQDGLRRKLLDPLRLYRPSLMQYAFHTGRARQRILLGGNQSGKTTAAAMEFGATARGKHLLTPGGEPMPIRYRKGRRLIMWVVGVSQDHISQTIYRVLFERGGCGMKAWWEDELGDYRILNPSVPADKALLDNNQGEDLEPIIPENEVDEWVWEGAAEHLFKAVRMKNGNNIYAFASTGNVKQGDPVDWLWVDEDIVFPEYVLDWRMRTVKTGGQFVWDAFPWSKNRALITLDDIAKKERDKPEPAVEKFEIWTSNNAYVDKKSLAESLTGMSEEEVAARDRGQFSFGNRLVYNEYHDAIHAVPQQYESEEEADPLTKLLNARGCLPSDWTRYLAIDPGTQQAGCLFVAVPPRQWCDDERYNDIVVVEDELYPKRKNVADFAQMIKQKVGGNRYRAFIIDGHAARQTPLNVGKRIYDFFVEAFQAIGLECELTGAYPIQSLANPEARRETVHTWLAKRSHGKPKLFVVKNKCPNLRMEFGSYQQRTVGDMNKEEVVDLHNHLMHCLEYLAANGCMYVEPEVKATTPKEMNIFDYVKALNQPRDSFVNLGPRQGT